MAKAAYNSPVYRQYRSELVEAIRRELFPTCGFCRRPITSNGMLAVDHMVRLVDGGFHRRANLRPAHRFCNESHSVRLTIAQGRRGKRRRYRSRKF